jgi:hypothetical protein
MSTLPTGDRGQRYEIRYRLKSERMITPLVLGWARTREGAREMVKAWVQAPDVLQCWIRDRGEHQQRGHTDAPPPEDD